MASIDFIKDIQTTGKSGCSLAAETMPVMGDFRIHWLSLVFCIALVFAGCRETEEVSTPEGRVAIGFSPATTPPLARAATMDGDGLRAGGFRVSAFMTGIAGWATAKATVTPGFMYNQLVEWDTDGEAWSYTPVKYWPGLADNTGYGKVSFFAWAPAGSGTPSASAATGAPTLSVTVSDANAGQFDLTADVLVDRTQNNGAVNFAFSHLLSRIGFSGKLDELYPDATVTVTSLKIKYAPGKVKNRGVYTFGDSDHASGSWALTEASSSSMATPGGGVGDQVAPDAGSPALSTAGTAVNAPARYLMLLPQTVTEGDLQAEVAWTVVSGEGANQSAVTNSATVSFPAMEWEQGHVYTYRLSVSLDAVQIDGVTVEAWGETDSYDQMDITYEANDGSGKKVVKHTFLNASVSKNIFTHSTAAYFLGWNTLANGSGSSYAPGAPFSGSTTLYARWSAGEALDIAYTGEAQYIEIQKDGEYKLEAWGAGGAASNDANSNGNGGYSQGIISLKAEQVIYVYVGGAGVQRINQTDYLDQIIPGGWNGGGSSKNYHITSYGELWGSGGGATDFRLVAGDTDMEWNSPVSINSRILVAGGGASGGKWRPDQNLHGGHGGGLQGTNGSGHTSDGKTLYSAPTGGSQTQGGLKVNGGTYEYGTNGVFGAGGNGSSGWGDCAGGGGYYGGGSSGNVNSGYGMYSGGGGSSFISGMTNCVAIDPTDTANDLRTQDTGSNTAALNYNTVKFGSSPTWTDGAEIIFTGPGMIDGAGYEWNTGEKAGMAGSMPGPSGGTMTGNAGNGYARITKLAE